MKGVRIVFNCTRCGETVAKNTPPILIVSEKRERIYRYVVMNKKNHQSITLNRDQDINDFIEELKRDKYEAREKEIKGWEIVHIDQCCKECASNEKSE